MSAIISPDQGNFRDVITTLEKDGSRKWIFAKKPSGTLYNWRSKVSILYLIIFFGLPLIQYKGEPLLMLNVVDRRFIIFGLHFGVQDLIVFGLAMLTFIVFVVLFTVVFGRLFCGWACPQTIFMEMVFRKIEYWIDGDAQAQRNLKKSEWNKNKIIKRSIKYISFFAVSFLIANTFLAYIIGFPELKKIITEPITQHIIGFFVLVLFSILFFAVYAFLREQICIVACPYGRLQGVMLDKKSIVVAYDYVRGEPRGKLKKDNKKHEDGSKCTGKCSGCTVIHEEEKQIQKAGDCIDCYACVAVCPTGIDIRNGTQLECINCTACIDACDAIMQKINKPKGLIRYASDDMISKGAKLKLNKRIISYSVVLMILMTLLAFTFYSHSSVDISILRASGQFYQEHDNGTISNLYTFKIANKKNTPLDIKLKTLNGEIEIIGSDTIIIAGGSEAQGQMFLYIDKNKIKDKKSEINIEIYDKDKLIKNIKTSFMAPIK